MSKGKDEICECKHPMRSHALRGSLRSGWRGQCEHPGCLCRRGVIAKGGPKPKLDSPEEKAQLYTLGDVKAREVVKVATGIKTLDEALDGGFAQNTTVLVAGYRGCGKSSLLTSVAGAMAKKTTVLYVSGEEDIAQFAYRAKRFGLSKNLDTLHVTDKANLDSIFEYAAIVKPGFIVVDSLQSVHGRDMNGMFVANKRTANYFSYQLKKLRQMHGATLVLVGHETKNGEIAGDSSLQHDVDVVCQMDPDEVTAARVLTIDKNRFGKTPGQFRFLIHDDRIEEVAAIPSLTYKAPEIMG
jgi:DNA repair protein RadA/Sms